MSIHLADVAPRLKSVQLLPVVSVVCLLMPTCWASWKQRTAAALGPEKQPRYLSQPLSSLREKQKTRVRQMNQSSAT